VWAGIALGLVVVANLHPLSTFAQCNEICWVHFQKWHVYERRWLQPLQIGSSRNVVGRNLILEEMNWEILIKRRCSENLKNPLVPYTKSKQIIEATPKTSQTLIAKLFHHMWRFDLCQNWISKSNSKGSMSPHRMTCRTFFYKLT